jgi:hypothetical protein
VLLSASSAIGGRGHEVPLRPEVAVDHRVRRQTLIRQAWKTADYYLVEALSCIDEKSGAARNCTRAGSQQRRGN